MHEWNEQGIEDVPLYECAGCGDYINANERYFDLLNKKVHFSGECASLYMITNYVVRLAGEGME